MRLRPLLSAAAGVALGASLLIAPATSAAGTTRYVDDDGKAGAAGCGGDANVKKTIQGAVNAAGNGDTILVCPGTYVETVEITDIRGLTLKSVKPWQAVIKNPESVPVAGGSSGAPFMVGIYGANDITVRGFKLEHRAFADCPSSISEIGILFVAARDISIRGNRVVGTGDTLSECGLAAGIMAGYPFGVASAASAAPAGLPSDLTTTGLIAYNTVRDHAFLGIAALSTVGNTAGSSGWATKVDIRNNSIRYYHLDQPSDACTVPPIAASQRRSLRSALKGTLPAGPGTTCFGIGIYQGAAMPDAPAPGVSGLISRNRVSSGPDAVPSIVPIAGEQAETAGQLIGILVVDQKHADGASTVRENILRRNTFAIMASDAAGIRVVDNQVNQALFGISIFDTEDGALVRDNRVLSSMIGIWASNEPVDSSPQPYYVTEDVLFRGNDTNGNGTSCEDETSGSGTEGTANTWVDNDAETNSSDPDGICGPKEL